MRTIVVLLLFAVAVAEIADEPWMEEDLEEPYSDETLYRRKRQAYVENPFEEHIRVKRRDDDDKPDRYRRSADYVRTPRQVHQYEVHELTDDHFEPSSPPFEEMLVASANQYHKVFAAPEVPRSARFLSAELSPHNAVNGPAQFVVPPVSNAYTAQLAPDHVPADVPIPVPSAPLTQPLQKLAPSDQFGAASGHHGHGHGHSQGGGHAHHGHHYGDHGGKSTKGYKDDHYVDKGAKGHKIDENHRKEYEEAAGKKKKHHDHAGHKGGHEEEAHGQRGSHFAEKKGHKKGHKSRGYHNKYHKDEFQKEHKFYDDFHKSGEHHRYGKFNAKHASNESGKKKAHHVNAGHDYVERGKKGYSNKGHLDADHKGYNGKGGHEDHNAHHSEYGKKGGKEGGSHWGYAKKN